LPAYAATPGLLHTSAGLLPVIAQMAAVNALALPMAPLAMSLFGSCRAAAMSAPDLPASTVGSYDAPICSAMLPELTNGNDPRASDDVYGGASYLVKFACCSGVSCCSGFWSTSSASTPWKLIRSLV